MRRALAFAEIIRANERAREGSTACAAHSLAAFSFAILTSAAARSCATSSSRLLRRCHPQVWSGRYPSYSSKKCSWRTVSFRSDAIAETGKE